MPKISQLPAGTTPTGSEQIPAVQGGSTVRLTKAQFDAVAQSFPGGAAVGTGASFGVPADAQFIVNNNTAAIAPFNHYLDGLEQFTARFAGPNNITSLVVSDGYGGPGGWGTQRANGTAALPTHVSSGDVIGIVSYRGYGTTGMSRAVANWNAVANQDFTDTAQGTRLEAYVTKLNDAGGAQTRILNLVGNNATFGTAIPVASGTIPLVDINVTGVTTLVASTNPVALRVLGADGANTAIALQAYGTSAQSVLQGFTAGGVAATPLGTPSGSNILSFQGFGWDTVEWGSGGVQTPSVGIRLQAAQTHAAGAHGTQMLFDVTPNGSATRTTALTIGNDQSLLGVNSIKSNNATAGIGYATGAGGAITQITSRTTGVTLNTITGAITLVSAAGSATAASFTVTNSAVAATDVIYINQKSGTDLYEIFITAVAAGSFKVTFFTTGGTTTEQPVFNFAVIKGVAA